MLIHREVHINIPIDCSPLRMCPLFIIFSWSHRSIILCQTEDSNIFQAQTIQANHPNRLQKICLRYMLLLFHPPSPSNKFENKPPFSLFCSPKTPSIHPKPKRNQTNPIGIFYNEPWPNGTPCCVAARSTVKTSQFPRTELWWIAKPWNPRCSTRCCGAR